MTSGSGTVLPLVRAVLEIPEAKASGVGFQHDTSHTGQGFLDLISGSAEVARMSRQVTKAERELAREAGVAIRTYTIGRGAVTAIVHPSRASQVAPQPVARLRELFFAERGGGDTLTWADLGAPEAAPLQRVLPAPKGGTGASFRKLLGVAENVPYAPGSILCERTSEVVRRVASDPNAIGIASLSLVDDTVNALGLTLPDGRELAATAHTVRRGVYPLRRPLNLVLRQPASSHAQLLVEWALSGAGQRAIEATGIIAARAP